MDDVNARTVPPHPGMTYASLRERFRWRIPAEFNIATACLAAPASAPALIAVDGAGIATTISFGDLDERSNRLGNGLREIGIGRGDVVGIVVPQSPATGLAHLALYKIGAIALPLAALFGPDALAFRLADSRARCVVAARSQLGKVEEAIRLAGIDASVVVVGDRAAGLASLDELMAGGSPRLDTVETTAQDPAFVIYTSGTTGPPKGALHAHRSLIGHLPGFELYYEFFGRDDDVIWTPADWAWIGGLMDVLLPSWYLGRPVLTVDADFDPLLAVDLMAAHRVTAAFLPPTALKMMRAAGVGLRNGALRAVFTGGEVLGAEILEWSRAALGATINEGYGQTEANLVVGNCASVWPVRPGSMGRAIPGHDVRVLDDDGAAVVGDVGEIAVRGPDPVFMLEYLNNPEATADKYRGEWLLTGDLGVEDEDGYLWFRSRKDDVIMSMGYRIGPGEIEESLMGHPAVAMCAVVGLADEVRGEVPAAFVVLRDGTSASPDLAAELQGHVRTRLAAHEMPRAIRFVDDLPRTTTGKIMRRALRDPN